jgi:hypothetical protein
MLTWGAVSCSVVTHALPAVRNSYNVCSVTSRLGRPRYAADETSRQRKPASG